MMNVNRRRDERGYAAILVALLSATVLLALCAVGVDVARWYVEVERTQKAADAAALAGVTYMPNDLASARSTATTVATKNGYQNSGDTTVSAQAGDGPSQLKVTISSRIRNSFGAAFGIPYSTITRSATADYTAPAPMGSPCNIFGNEPSSTSGAAQPSGSALPSPPAANCTSTPNFWAAVEGPSTDKLQGDRYGTLRCTETSTYTHSGAYKCASNQNSEYKPDGYYFAVHVEKTAINVPINVQVYDPVYAVTGVKCASLPSSGSFDTNMNPFATTDAKVRYSPTASFCTGDYSPGSPPSTAGPVTTTFVLRSANDADDPAASVPISGCARQFNGTTTTPTYDILKSTKDAYNPEFASTFHQWYSLCTFTPDRAGNYFLQVRTNLSFGGTQALNKNPNGRTVTNFISTPSPATIASAGNDTSTAGLNSFSLRAVPQPAGSTAYRNLIAVSGWDRMPVLQNLDSSSATFNLARALPNAKGQYLTFDFFDPSDGVSSGTVTVLPPPDASGSVKAGSGVPGCRTGRDDANPSSYSTVTGCKVTVNRTTDDGHVIHMVIPIPNDYSCDDSTLSGCWFQVSMSYGSGVTDYTSWNANIGGDPVRLIQ